MMWLISLVLFGYVFYSLILPLRWKWRWQLSAGFLLLLIAQKNTVFLWIGGGMFFSPELPRWLIIFASVCYGALILLFFLLIAKDLIRLVWSLAGRLRPRWRRPFPHRPVAALLCILALVLAIDGTWEALRVPAVRTEEVILPRLPAALDGFTVVLLADLHASALNTEPFLRAIVDKANALQPDLIVLNGDMVDGKVANRLADVAPLADLRARCGVFASPGNHEYYSGFDEWQAHFAALGLPLLVNQHVLIEDNGATLALAGLADHAAERFNAEPPDIRKALDGVPPETVVLLLAHQPRQAARNAAAGVDLQLSGHTHGGLIVLFDRLVALFNDGLVSGWYEVDGMPLYVSPGTALWNGFPIRLGVPAEITRLVLRAAPGQ
ncbi:metallophosphoesterase [Victivallis sp. Marseille-Q1083]|uniref:metallophosphoesterase n=1 Tax=Victivallis sp. Marseille-Q1083 TaxID=2717288 RepID=UPI00158C035E|nr:metallophosphoesterase [Victivallis sp. Marseille-Q1083]